MSFAEQIAKRKLNAPAGWEMCGWKRVGTDALIVEGGIPRPLKSGPDKGRRTWRDSQITTAVVTEAEIEAEKRRFEHETGKCANCEGAGEVFASWSVKDGIKYRPCRTCGGTKLATPIPR